MSGDDHLRLALHRIAVHFWVQSLYGDLGSTERTLFLTAQRALNPLLADASLLAPLGRKPNPYAS